MQATSTSPSAAPKKLLITFDYELFLGNRSGTVEACMLLPTKKIIRLLDKYQAKAIFFVDTTYLLRLKKQALSSPACINDFEKVASQLRELVGQGHYVYPHLHPHWIDAEYLPETNQWRLNSTDKYLFKNISPAERTEVFDGSVALLKEIIQPAFPAYEVNAFRAGGWSIQPFTNFAPYFEKNNFLYEFSVLGQFYQFTNAQYFDFSTAPEKPIYRFGNDVNMEDPAGRYIQFNISSIEIPFHTQVLNRIWIKLHSKLTNDHTFHQGEGQSAKALDHVSPASPKGKNIATAGHERIAVELLTLVKLPLYNKFMDEHDYMHFISHPKMITGHNLKMFEKFLDRTFKQYRVNTDFKKMVPS